MEDIICKDFGILVIIVLKRMNKYILSKVRGEASYQAYFLMDYFITNPRRV